MTPTKSKVQKMEAESVNVDDEKKWSPVSRVERRVLGVLVEKSKTTPDTYPMTLNSITTACNQKSNRKPLMQLELDDVEEVLDDLRQKKVVVEIQGDGRKAKYKHLLYEWLGVDKVELAIMGELLLRGEQTLGDLRGRANRMEKIADVGELRPIVKSLMERDLIVALTPEGRGQMVSHNLYESHEIDKVTNNAVAALDVGASATEPKASRSVAKTPASTDNEISRLQEQIQKLQATVEELSRRLDLLES